MKRILGSSCIGGSANLLIKSTRTGQVGVRRLATAHSRVEIVVRFLLTVACLQILTICSLASSQPADEQTTIAGGSQHTDYVRAQLRILALAAEAKRAFHERAEPLIPKLIFVQAVDLYRDLFSALRDYAEESFDAASDALTAEAINPSRTPLMESALLKFVEADQTSALDSLFTELIQAKTADARVAAVSLRHSVALTELPAALTNSIKSQSPLFSPRPLPPLGEKTLPVYKHAAELDPADAWTWIIIAILEDDKVLSESAIRNAERSALAADDWRAAVFSKQLFAFIALEPRGEFAEADRACTEALRLARQKRALHSSDVTILGEVARDLVWVGAMKARHGAAGEAGAAFDEALTIRKQLAASRPDDTRGQVDLIASYARLWFLLNSQGLKEEANQNFAGAWRLYDAIASRSGFVPIFDPFQSSALRGAIFEVLMSASALTLILGLTILTFYRRRMARLMHATAKVSTIQAARFSTPSKPLVSDLPGIPITSLNAGRLPRTTAYRSEPISRVNAALRSATLVYAVAGCAFGTVATYLYFQFTGLDFSPNRAVTIFLTWAWPTILTLNFLWGRNRRRLCFLLLAYFGVLFSVCLRVAFSDTPPLTLYGIVIPPFFQPMALWGLSISETLFLLLFLNRSIRTVGAVLFIFMICVMCGYIIGIVVGSMYSVGNAMIAFTRALGVTSATATVTATTWFDRLAGMGLFALLGWFVIDFIRRRYEAKWFSDQVMVFDSVWLFQTLLLWQSLFNEAGHRASVALGAFGLYKFVSWVCPLLAASGAPQRQPARLLLLRTFGFRRRSERLFDQLSARWPYAGPIQLIAAPDLAGHSIDPAKLLMFLSGGLHRRFLIEPSDLDRRLGAFDDSPDPDGRYRVNELMCGDDAWRDAVGRLMEKSDLVVMDLRGFSAKHQGCIIELQSLIDLVPVGQTVLLVDETTDVPFLRQTLGNCWCSMAETSPNRESAFALTLLNVGIREVLAVDALLLIADEMLAKPSLPSSRTSPQAQLGKLSSG